MKTCKRCKLTKSLDNFGKNNRTSDKHANLCRPCDSARVSEWAKKNPDRYKEYYIKRGISRHGITQDQFSSLLKTNNGCCWICDAKPDDSRLCIDHDHSCCSGPYSCGKCIRGLLCSNCNKMVGHFEKGNINIKKIISYLK